MFVLMSDLHLRRQTWAKYPKLTGDSYCSLQQIIDFCLAHQAPLVAAGDIFDKQLPDALSVQHMVSACDRMQAAGLPIYYIQGQHERSQYSTWLGIHAWPRHVHQQTFHIDGLTFYGLDWTPAERVKAELATVPAGTDVLVAHQVWEDFVGFNPECCFQDVHHARYLLTGDYHQHLVLETDNFHGHSLQVFSPGSMCLQALDEPATKAFYSCTSTGAELSANSELLATREMYRYGVETLDQLGQLASELGQVRSWMQAEDNPLPEDIRTPIVVVEFNEELQAPDGGPLYAYLVMLTSNFHAFLQPYQLLRAQPLVVPSQLTLQGDVMQTCLEELEPDDNQRQLINNLLSSADVKSALDAMLTDFVNSTETEAVS